MKQYSDDKFTKVLGDKLSSLREEPPADMFDRIEQTLLAEGLAKPATAQPTKRVVPLWNRPFVRGVAATMAAAMLALVFVVTLRNNAPEEIRVVAEQQIEATPTIEPQVLAAPIKEEVVVALSTPRATKPAKVVMAEEVKTEEPLVEVVEEQPTIAESEPDTATASQPTKRERRKSRQTGSSRHNQQELEEYWRMAPSGKNTSKNLLSSARVGLYAQNVGFNYGHIVLNNLANGSMIVGEQSEISSGSSYLLLSLEQQNPSTKLEHFMPVTAGVTVSFLLNDWLGVDSGLLYTNVYSKSNTDGSLSHYSRKRTLDYLGVPLALSLYFAEFDRWALYGRLGGTVELCINAKDKTYMDGVLEEKNAIDVPPLTFSLDAAVGATYDMWSGVGLFGEVGCSYWNAPDGYVENYRTVHPLSLSTRFGVRFTFN